MKLSGRYHGEQHIQGRNIHPETPDAQPCRLQIQVTSSSFSFVKVKIDLSPSDKIFVKINTACEIKVWIFVYEGALSETGL